MIMLSVSFNKMTEKLSIFGCDVVGDLKRMNKRQIYFQGLTFAMVLCVVFLIYKFLVVITNCTNPIIVVLSGSMEPAIYRGDILFVTNYESDPPNVGDITIFRIHPDDTPFMHRVVRVHHKDDGSFKLLTKGDNNDEDDRGLYENGIDWMEKKYVLGRSRAIIPYIGHLSLIVNDYPQIKYIGIVCLGIHMMLTREN